MAEHWLQIKGDPSVRRFVFEQTRTASLFDVRIEELMTTVAALLTRYGVFHAKIHFSSNQLTCWLYNDPYRYRVFVGEEVFAADFLHGFARVVAIDKPLIAAETVPAILAEFARLRLKDESVYLRNGSLNLINGLIGMTFSCDGSHYLPVEEFFATVRNL
ncbi:MAG: hypothetical protein Kow0096_19530 [Thiohalomonadaceae bacterium]